MQADARVLRHGKTPCDVQVQRASVLSGGGKCASTLSTLTQSHATNACTRMSLEIDPRVTPTTIHFVSATPDACIRHPCLAPLTPLHCARPGGIEHFIAIKRQFQSVFGFYACTHPGLVVLVSELGESDCKIRYKQLNTAQYTVLAWCSLQGVDVCAQIGGVVRLCTNRRCVQEGQPGVLFVAH